MANRQSPFLTLKLNDFWKGFLTAALTAALTAGWELLNKGDGFDTDSVKKMLFTASMAAGGYLVKNLSTNNKDEFLKKDKPNTIS